MERVLSVFSRGRGRRKEEEKTCSGEVRYTKARQGLGRWRTWLLFLFLLGHSMLGVSAAAEGSQRGAAVVLRNARRNAVPRGKTNGICLHVEAAKRRG